MKRTPPNSKWTVETDPSGMNPPCIVRGDWRITQTGVNEYTLTLGSDGRNYAQGRCLSQLVHETNLFIEQECKGSAATDAPRWLDYGREFYRC